MAGQVPLGSFPKSEANQNPDLNEMPLDKLTELVQWPSKMEEFTEKARSGYVPVPEVEAEPAEPVQSEPTPEAPVETEAVADPPPADKEPPVPDDSDLLRARLEAYEAEQRKLEAKLAGREAGEKGYIKQLQREIERLKSSSVEDPGEGDPQPMSIRQAEPDSLATYVVGQAINSAAASFIQSHPEMQELHGDVEKYVRESGYDPKTILMTGDPIHAGREVTRVLEEAFWHVQAERKRSAVTELQKRRADSMRGVEEAKRRSAVSASGTSAPAPKPIKQTKDLSLEELQERVARLTRR